MKIRASHLLEAAGLDPERIRSMLPRVDPDRVWVRSASRRFRAVWVFGTTAIALPWGIYVVPERLTGPASELGALMVHELTHIEQWRRLGPLGWVRSYLGDYARGRSGGLDHRAAYREIALEVEARAVARTVAG